MEIEEEVQVGDLVQMRKPHPCGSLRWVVTRTGADIKMRCERCGHVVMLDRIIFLLEARPGAEASDEAAPEGGETEPAPEAEKVEEELENLEEAVAELISAEGTEEETAPEAEPGTDCDEPDENGESGFLSASDRMVRAAVRALKPVIARLPEKERASAADAALRAMRSLPKGEKPPRSAYAALAGAARAEDPGDLGKRIISSRNINYRK